MPGQSFLALPQETKIFDDLDVAIGNKNVVETIEDAQGRLLIRTATAITETKAISLEVTTNGEYKIIEYKAVYNKGGQSGYPKLSANKLAPDFSENINNCLHPDVVGKKIEITVTGQMNSNAAKIGDVELANQAAGIAGKSTPTGYTWHHMDDFDPATGKCTMQLVKITEHQKCLPHTGGVKQWENFSGQTYLRN